MSTVIWILVCVLAPTIGAVPMLRLRQGLRLTQESQEGPTIPYHRVLTPTFEIGSRREAESQHHPLLLRNRRQYPTGYGPGGDAGYRNGLNRIYSTDFASLLEAASSLSPSELQVFTTSFATALAQGLSASEATPFADRMVGVQRAFALHALHPQASVAALALAFQTCVRIGTGQGMSETVATNFATSMIFINAIYGVQTIPTVATFAQSYLNILLIATKQGMSAEQGGGFATAVMRIQADFGIQSDGTLAQWGQDYLRYMAMGPAGLEGAFALAMIQLQARRGRMPVSELNMYAELLVSLLAEGIAEGRSEAEARTSAFDQVLARGGFADHLLPVVRPV